MSEDKPQRRTWRDRVRRDSARSAADRRRLVLRLGIAALAVVIFVIVPGYIATRPQFVSRYADLGEQYHAWSVSVHAQVPCQNCHIPPKRTSRAAYAVRMLGEFYLSLVLPSREPRLYATPTNEACQSCHIDLRTVSPSGDLNIPHKAHVNVLKLKCVDCHNALVHTTNAAGNHTPSMTTCLTCHDGTTAKRECSACHTNKAVPETHQASNWLVVHPEEQKRTDCSKCHKWTADWCARCHQSRPKSHSKRWRSEHRTVVKKHRNCEACHVGEFCVRCHGEVPGLNLDPALKLVQ